MDAKERKEILKSTFNTVADGYENEALRFFSKSACYMAECFKFKGKENVLDVATGTGHMALAISKHLPKGKVTGIDFSEGMLSQAKAKADKAKVKNVQFLEMDMQALEFPKEHFDAVSCAFGIFFVEYIAGQLKHILEKIKPSGKIIISHSMKITFCRWLNYLTTVFENTVLRSLSKHGNKSRLRREPPHFIKTRGLRMSGWSERIMVII